MKSVDHLVVTMDKHPTNVIIQEPITEPSKACITEESLVGQKARIYFLKEGDLKTIFLLFS